MPLKKLPYVTLDKLIKENLSSKEDLHTERLINELKNARVRGWLDKKELINICYWKSARSIRLIESNHPKTIKKITQSAFSSSDEIDKMKLLVRLKGVGIPMGSSILMLTNPARYGVIDIRVWEVLYKMRTVKSNPKGVNFRFKEWEEYICTIRLLSKKHKVSVRSIERILFTVHQDNQDGNLYRNLG